MSPLYGFDLRGASPTRAPERVDEPNQPPRDRVRLPWTHRLSQVSKTLVGNSGQFLALSFQSLFSFLGEFRDGSGDACLIQVCLGNHVFLGTAA